MYEVFSKDAIFNSKSVSLGTKMGNNFDLSLLAFVEIVARGCVILKCCGAIMFKGGWTQ